MCGNSGVSSMWTLSHQNISNIIFMVLLGVTFLIFDDILGYARQLWAHMCASAAPGVVYIRFFMESGGPGGSPELASGRGRAPSGVMVILHFRLKMMIFRCVY